MVQKQAKQIPSDAPKTVDGNSCFQFFWFKVSGLKFQVEQTLNIKHETIFKEYVSVLYMKNEPKAHFLRDESPIPNQIFRIWQIVREL